MPFQIGIDVGGTFTDLIAVDQTGATTTLKVPSTPTEPAKAVLEALSVFQRRASRPEIALLSHSTTIATNALLGQLQLELPRVGLITTAGFRDIIEIGRQNRSELYNLFVERPRPLVERADRRCVRERIDFRGHILLELNEDDVAAAIAHFKHQEIRTVAVCFLNSYVNAAHEERAAQLIAQAMPEIAIVQSSRADPEYREYERFSTAVVNAALRPIVGHYVDAICEGLRAMEIRAPLYVMQSHGGMTRAEDVSRVPATLIESGPASGVIAAAALAREHRIGRALSFDMGGTTAKAGTIIEGRVQVVQEFEAAGRVHGGRTAKGSGYPVRFPFIDLAEASAGGGTIAWSDDAGSLHVGPSSAGADPGPACYGKGLLATVTDANVVLGRLRSDALLGGAFPIQAGAALAAIAALGERCGLSAIETAAGIVRLVDHEMAKIVRIVTVERGLDPRDFALLAFGGNGPLHACALAEELGIRWVIVPPSPGLFSAFGLVVAPLQSAVVAPLMRTAEGTSDAELRRLFEGLRASALRELQAQFTSKEQAFESASVAETIDMRYQGQSYELSVAAQPTLSENIRAFHEAHAATYGYNVLEEPVEFVNLRLTASAPRKPMPYRFEAHRLRDPAAHRRVWINDAWRNVPILARDGLRERSVEGPAIVDEYDATTLIPPAWTATLKEAALHLRAA